jgi:hypothetical protein
MSELGFKRGGVVWSASILAFAVDHSVIPEPGRW